MTSNPRTKEVAIKGLVNNIKNYCAALTPPARELWDRSVTGTGSLLVPQWDAASLLASRASSFGWGCLPAATSRAYCRDGLLQDVDTEDSSAG